MPKSRSRKDYDEEKALAAGLTRDETGRFGSRDPVTGRIFKAPGHSTLIKSVKEDQALGFRNVIQGTRLQSQEEGSPQLQMGSVSAPRDVDLSGAVFPSELDLAIKAGLAPRSAERRKKR